MEGLPMDPASIKARLEFAMKQPNRVLPNGMPSCFTRGSTRLRHKYTGEIYVVTRIGSSGKKYHSDWELTPVSCGDVLTYSGDGGYQSICRDFEWAEVEPTNPLIWLGAGI